MGLRDFTTQVPFTEPLCHKSCVTNSFLPAHMQCLHTEATEPGTWEVIEVVLVRIIRWNRSWDHPGPKSTRMELVLGSGNSQNHRTTGLE
ncbi:hypothetical protein DUI87_21415 [Hirundo rustica rustica]|uniref:Uncharacterized protein n=1 Tax=Hirundo rustica rustica TaxID=333673 RepID=A0A3M0JMG4_HIRRU|nr:hypothetical protein DUI87_21415 [Hirundo rustica rustica]